MLKEATMPRVQGSTTQQGGKASTRPIKGAKHPPKAITKIAVVAKHLPE
jgi:hypothetical protein